MDMRRFVLTATALKLTLLVGFFGLYFASESAVQSPAHATPTPAAQTTDAINRPVSQPYVGDLSIFEEAERDKALQIDRVMDILDISGGKSVADIGAGSGWFTVRAAKRVGTDGKVYAAEINKSFIDHINERARKEGFTNIVTVLGKEDDPTLKKDSVDAVLILKTYHEIAQPIRFLKNLRPSLRKGALVGIIDRNGAGDDHGINGDTIVDEAKRAGFTLKERHHFVKDGMDYFLVFADSQ